MYLCVSMEVYGSFRSPIDESCYVPISFFLFFFGQALHI